MPTAKYRLDICTDGNQQNTDVLQKVFTNGSLNYAKVIKIKKENIVIGQIVKNILGNMPKNEIGIRYIDGYCARLRERVSRYSRRAKTFSKKKTAFYNHLFIFQAYNNFIEIYKEKQTPCMIENITTRKWDWNDIFRNYYHSH